MRASRFIPVLLMLGSTLAAPAAIAQESNQEWLCDSSTTNCRTPLLNLIAAETIGIDAGFWFMEDSRYATALVNAHNRGVRVRVLMDTKANTPYPGNVPNLQTLRDAGIPMRRMTSSYLHWKMMLFAGQHVVQFGSANYSPHAFAYQEPLVDFIDESIYFSNDPNVVNSFKTKFDDAWVDTSRFTNYANVSGTPARAYPVFTIDPELSFPTSSDFGTRSVNRYNAEPSSGGIDSIIYRITDRRHTDAIIAAHERGVPVRIVTEPNQYREPARYMHAWNVDRLYAAGVSLRHRRHLGSNHLKLTLLHDQQMAIFGSQNWTRASGNAQYEHNYFTRKGWIYQWFVDRFERTWQSSTETEPFVPLPPDTPSYRSPASGAQVTGSSVTLRWYAGLWAHRYDIYFGTAPNPPLLAANVELGNSTSSSDLVEYTVTGLSEDTAYYWRIVSKTMANVERSGATWNFRTGEPPQPGTGDVVLWASRAPTVRGAWTVASESTAAGGARIGTANAGVRVTSPLASPADYLEMSFSASAGVPYRLWMRGKAVSNNWANDSAFVQFSGSVTSTGSPTWRIGTTSATTVTIEDCTSCGLSGWGWNDNATTSEPGALGPLVYFESSGAQTIRVQMREDGLSIDQIVISRDAFLTAAPGTTKNDGTTLPESGGTDSDPPPPPLPSGWQSQDVGSVGVAGSATGSNGSFTVSGAGADVWGTTDALHYAYRSLSGDGTITARVASLSGTQAWVKIGVMIRGSTAANSAHAFMLVSKDKGLAFQYRPSNGAASLHISGGSGTAPRWVRLARAGNVITASVSTDGSAWTVVGSDTFAMPANVLVGLAAHSHTTSALATGEFDHVSVNTGGEAPPPPPLPEGWQSQDIGPVGPAGSASESGGEFTVSGAGADVWGTTDAFHYAYRSLPGDGTIAARVVSIDGTEAWTKMGVMVRASTATNAAYAFMLVSVGKGLAFQRRTADGATATHTSGGSGTAPRWVRLARAGNVITASISTDGTAWTVVDSDTFSMPANVLVGLAAHSHTTSALATAVFDNVSVTASQ